jgi:F-type H+-transporting ATPase subunit beta
MHEPPGTRLGSLLWLTMAEYFRACRSRKCCCSSTTSSGSQAGSGIHAARPDAVRGRGTSRPGRRDGPAAGADHLGPRSRDHLHAGDLRAGRRLHRRHRTPRSPTSTPPRTRAVHLDKGIYPRWTRWRLPRAFWRRSSSARDHAVATEVSGSCEVPGPTGHHRHPGMDEPRRQDHGVASALDRRFSQNTYAATVFTGIEGSFVPVKDTVEAFNGSAGGLRHLPGAGVLHVRWPRRRGAERGQAQDQ